MNILNVKNPFNAPVYHEETVSSTMDVSHRLVSENAPQSDAKFIAHGTVITADFQEAGRGRINERSWEMKRGENLAFTIILHYPQIEEIPKALTLRAGLAVSLAVEDFSPSLKNSIFVKWPNDIMINGKKTAGILCEAADGYVHIGIGINVMQKEFPDHLKEKATSIFYEQITYNREQITDNSNLRFDEQLTANGSIYKLLALILQRLYNELETALSGSWKFRLEQRLYKKGEHVTFIEGAADSGKMIKGILRGIGESGELLILPENENEVRSFFSGELKY
ncbi:MAG: biotin--[acetyl-CoA-carboxylase] ligase [Treponema sp.]|nr:biotin--[acetyl-CoA-carboxylase] ligase [Treponema sp.]